MTSIGIFTAMALFAAAGSASAQPGEVREHDRDGDVTRQQVIEHADHRFARLDLDHDGRATAEEARRAFAQRREEQAGRAFERLDVDRNGSLSRAEFEQGRERRAERRLVRGPRHGMRGRRHGGPGRHAERMFAEQGFVTLEQMRERALARFDRLDLDRDGTLTASERRQSRDRFRRHREERRGRVD
jgi:Ca2+-binding EF-hand superfamily protein